MIAGAVEVTSIPPIVAVTVLLPSMVPVKVAAYVPFLLSLTALNVPWPPLVLPNPNATVKPPVVSWLPAASSACNVTVIGDARGHAWRPTTSRWILTGWLGRECW